jgi:hypothetical protein
MQLLDPVFVLQCRSHRKWVILSTNPYVQAIATKSGTETLTESGNGTIEIGKDKSGYDT